MPIFDITIPFKKCPHYTVRGVEALTQAHAISLAVQQAYLEGCKGPYKKPKVTEIK